MAAKKCAVDETWPKFKKQGGKIHNQGAVQAQAGGIECEMEAFFWFFGKSLVSVCGARQWGKQKKHELISKATLMGTGEKLVTKSDEAFALLMYKDYNGKWKKQGNVKDDKDEQHEEDEGEGEDEDEQHEEDEETVQSVPGKKKSTIKAARGK